MAKVIPIVRIVDDDETFCMSQKMFLQAMGWFVLIYNSAKTFLEDDDPSQPGCLILDMRMPEMTGLELQTALVAHGAPLPIIFLTGHGDVNMAVHALQHGAFDFLQKPVDPEKLFISLPTVKMHRSSAFTKLGVKSALEAYWMLETIGVVEKGAGRSRD